MGKYRSGEHAVIWHCPHCGAYNLHPLDWEEFYCINCHYCYFALADNETEKRKDD